MAHYNFYGPAMYFLCFYNLHLYLYLYLYLSFSFSLRPAQLEPNAGASLRKRCFATRHIVYQGSQMATIAGSVPPPHATLFPPGAHQLAVFSTAVCWHHGILGLSIGVRPDLYFLENSDVAYIIVSIAVWL